MEFGISTAALFSRMDTEDALSFIPSLGTNVVEVFLQSYSEYTQTFGRELKRRARQASVSITSVHAMSQQFEAQIFSIGRRQSEDSISLYEKVLKQGKLLGAKRYVMHGPALLKGALKNAQLERVGRIATDLAELARKYGIKLCWENVSWCMFNTPEFAPAFLKNVKSDNLRFTFDVKQAARSGYDPLLFVAAMGERLEHVHLCDYTVTPDGLRLSLPGTGEFDFARLGRMLRGMGYDGAVILEPYSDLYKEPAEMAVSLDYLRDVMS